LLIMIISIAIINSMSVICDVLIVLIYRSDLIRLLRFAVPRAALLTTQLACRFSDEHALQSNSKTWYDCHRCGFTYIARESSKLECARLEEEKHPYLSCSQPSYRFIDHGLYAPQLAWWLRFFPPDRFMFISAWQLRDPDTCIQVRYTGFLYLQCAVICLMQHKEERFMNDPLREVRTKRGVIELEVVVRWKVDVVGSRHTLHSTCGSSFLSAEMPRSGQIDVGC
jgi:hypothetical protein